MEHFKEAVGKAAAAAAAYDPDSLPAGLSAAERKHRLLGLLKQCAADCDLEREARLRERYPQDTVNLVATLVPGYVKGGERKPPAYYRGLSQLVRHWMSGPDAVGTTAREDVTWLNSLHDEVTYSPGIISRDLTRAVLDNLFKHSGLGEHRPRDCNSLARIKRAIKAGHANNAAKAIPFGSIAKVAGDSLVGKQTVKIGKNGKHPAIRVNVGGKRLWLRLDAFEAGLDAIGFGKSMDQTVPPDPSDDVSPDNRYIDVDIDISRKNGLAAQTTADDAPCLQRGRKTGLEQSAEGSPLLPPDSIDQSQLGNHDRITKLTSDRRALEIEQDTRLAEMRAAGDAALDPSADDLRALRGTTE